MKNTRGFCYRINPILNRCEYWEPHDDSWIGLQWRRSCLQDISEEELSAMGEEVVQFSDTWCEPFEGMEDAEA